MLFLLFHIGSERFVLEARRVVEVLPLLGLKKYPQAPRGFAGILNYRGRPVPTIDLCQLTCGQPAAERLSTRIVLVRTSDKEDDKGVVGLIAERATQMLRKDPGEFVESGFRSASAPYLGPIILDPAGTVQWIRAEYLLSEPFRQLIFSEVAESAHGQD
jgi:chemotaxis-related protein WspB